ncbi:hypothetical protein M595_1504 [Lyngbya aestuarii BL J]|uniref:Uncharacterized protein n=1 Tax=Lyngbya aestuarii BL J TaxID=1348334 RepID=U7QMP1_9CYAN|nr:hypothetical protein M595_1504 [Lyngbya aestuarii BL J]
MALTVEWLGVRRESAVILYSDEPSLIIGVHHLKKYNQIVLSLTYISDPDLSSSNSSVFRVRLRSKVNTPYRAECLRV